MASQTCAREPCHVATAMQVVCYASIDSKPYTHFDPGPPSWLQGVKRTALQLVSIACFLIASKHEEVCPWPHIIPLAANNIRPSAVLLLSVGFGMFASDRILFVQQVWPPSVHEIPALTNSAFKVHRRTLHCSDCSSCRVLLRVMSLLLIVRHCVVASSCERASFPSVVRCEQAMF